MRPEVALFSVREMRERMAESRENLDPRNPLYGPLSDETWNDLIRVCDEWNALLDVAEAAKHVAEAREGHTLGGESPLYVRLCGLDERLSRFDWT